MDIVRIATLLEPFLDHPLSDFQLNQISIYIDLLMRWNARINLTAIRTEEEIVTRHFGESLFMARHLFPDPNSDPKAVANPNANVAIKSQCHPERSENFANSEVRAQSKDPYPLPSPEDRSEEVRSLEVRSEAARSEEVRSEPIKVLDIGSGPGFPGLPIKLWSPTIDLTLVESNQKKATFLKEVVRALTLTNVNVITTRAETVAVDPTFPRSQVVTLRAVEHFEVIMPQAVALLTKAPSGTVALLISSAQIPHTTESHIKWNSPISVPSSNSRVLLLGSRKA